MSIMNGSSPARAAPPGTTLKTTVERGHAYMVPRLYNVEITLEKILRGTTAGEIAKKIAGTEKPLKEDWEYLCAFIKFGYFERGRVSGRGAGDEGETQFVAFGGGSVDVTYTLAEGQFMVFSADGETEFELPAVARQPEPSLTGREFHPGETRRGCILFQAPQTEQKPLLVFKREHVEGVFGIWGYVWFQLY